MTIIEEAERLFNELREMSRDGEGVTRPTYSKKETEAMELILRHAAATTTSQLTAWFDLAANLHVTLRGSDEKLPHVLCGSHMDSVPQGGNYDGAAGVVAGLLALLNIAKNPERPKRSITLLALRGEESAWFGKCYLGSLAIFGKLTSADLGRRRRDALVLSGPEKDLSVFMTEAGAKPESLRKEGRLLSAAASAAFIELHIEQGPVLEASDLPLGVVTGIRGNVRHQVVCRGEGGHSGTVPMQMRHDPVMATADLLAVLRLKATDGYSDMVMTVGQLHTDATRDAVSVIPDVVRFSLEWRSLDAELLTSYGETVLAVAGAIEKRHGVKFEFGEPTRSEPAEMNYDVQQVITSACMKAGVPHRSMPSGAGHDAAVFAAEGVPTGMIFVRNQNGSHNPKEAMRLDDFEKGVQVLEQTLLTLANR